VASSSVSSREGEGGGEVCGGEEGEGGEVSWSREGRMVSRVGRVLSEGIGGAAMGTGGLVISLDLYRVCIGRGRGRGGRRANKKLPRRRGDWCCSSRWLL